MEIITLIIIGLSLSIDAFTLSLAYGLLKIPKRIILLTATSVGFFHFFMPLIGHIIGDIITSIVNIDSKYILITVLILILIEMIKSLKEEKEEYCLTFINIIIFSSLVSFDSLSLGLGIKYITENILLASIIFTILSFTFTYLGFIFGKYLSKKAEKSTKKIGIVLLLLTIVYFLCK